jgi:hypothetical protein
LVLQDASQVGVDFSLDLFPDLAPVVVGLLHVLRRVALWANIKQSPVDEAVRMAIAKVDRSRNDVIIVPTQTTDRLASANVLPPAKKSETVGVRLGCATASRGESSRRGRWG